MRSAELLADVRAACAQHGVRIRDFGRLAIGDPSIERRLEGSRFVQDRTTRNCKVAIANLGKLKKGLSGGRRPQESYRPSRSEIVRKVKADARLAHRILKARSIPAASKELARRVSALEAKLAVERKALRRAAVTV